MQFIDVDPNVTLRVVRDQNTTYNRRTYTIGFAMVACVTKTMRTPQGPAVTPAPASFGSELERAVMLTQNK